MTNNSTIESDDKQSEDSDPIPPITIFHLSNDNIVMGRIVGTSKEIISLHFPVQLRTFFDNTGSFNGFSTMPYLLPFLELDGRSVVNLHVQQITSFASPSKELKETYLTMLHNIINQKESMEATSKAYNKDFDLAAMEIPGIAH